MELNYFIKFNLFWLAVLACCEEFMNRHHQENQGPPDWDPEDFADDYNLRFRNPYAHNLSYDDEILYLISKVSLNRIQNIPFGYVTTGCQVIARKNRDLFRITMLNNFKSNDYVKAPLSKFISLGKYFYAFNLFNTLLVTL